VNVSRDPLAEVLAHMQTTVGEINSCCAAWKKANDDYSSLMNPTRNKPSRSGTTVEMMRLRAMATYEAMLDAIAVQSRNVDHLQRLSGRT
jgi:hypothetical protein